MALLPLEFSFLQSPRSQACFCELFSIGCTFASFGNTCRIALRFSLRVGDTQSETPYTDRTLDSHQSPVLGSALKVVGAALDLNAADLALDLYGKALLSATTLDIVPVVVDRLAVAVDFHCMESYEPVQHCDLDSTVALRVSLGLAAGRDAVLSINTTDSPCYVLHLTIAGQLVGSDPAQELRAREHALILERCTFDAESTNEQEMQEHQHHLYECEAWTM